MTATPGTVRVDWPQERGLFYKVQSSTDLGDLDPWTDETTFTQAEEDAGSFTEPADATERIFYRVLRSGSGTAVETS